MLKKLIYILSINIIILSFQKNTTEIVSFTSWYGDKFHGKKTASGEIYNMYHLTAAHKTLPFGTKIKITNIKNNKSVIVRINDRGPFIKGRDLDLSKSAFSKIANLNTGIIKIKYKIIKNHDENIKHSDTFKRRKTSKTNRTSSKTIKTSTRKVNG